MNRGDNIAVDKVVDEEAQRPPVAEVGRNDMEPTDGGWGRIRGEIGTACPVRKKGLWDFAMRYLTGQDPLRPLAVQAAEIVAAHIPVEEDEKLALHHAAIIRSIRSKGIERGNKEWKDKYDHSNYKQKKARMEETAFKFAQAGQLFMEGQGEKEGLGIPQGREKMEGMEERLEVPQQERITENTQHEAVE